MNETASPNDWKVPEWHPDLGDPLLEFDLLKDFAVNLRSAEPRAELELHSPEAGLLYVQGRLGTGQRFEIYAVPSVNDRHRFRLALFLKPNEDDEEERYFECPSTAVQFLLDSQKHGPVARRK